MDFRRLERIYEEQFIDRSWWGNFTITEPPVKKSLGSARLADLVAVCAKIALRMTGEIPRIVLSNKAPNLSVDTSRVTLNVKLLRFDLPEEIRINALFGSFLHELAHLIYTRRETVPLGERRYTSLHQSFLHMVEDRRVESLLVQEYPGYYVFLYTARRLALSVGWLGCEKHPAFYDSDEALCSYICSKILYPNFLEDVFYRKEIEPGNIGRMKKVDSLLDQVEDYGKLTYKQAEELAGGLRDIFGDKQLYYQNFCLQEVESMLKTFEGYRSDQEIRLAETVIRDMQRTFNPEIFHFYARTGEVKNLYEQHAVRKIIRTIREKKAGYGEISDRLLSKARELSEGIRLQLSLFSAKTDKNRIWYEQDSGELDEEELYQSRFNKYIFYEEVPTFSALLEIILLLDLSGSMVTGDKIALQTELTLALVLAFERYANTVTYAVYGHRCDDDGIEITCFHEPGQRLQLAGFFSQEALYANADGYAMEHCFGKFRSDSKHKLFLMISDGTPSVAGQDGEDAREQVREAVYRGRKMGIDILSIGIDNFDQTDLYEEFIPYTGHEAIVRLSRWLKKKFAAYADETVF